jgi:AcrR family transcriptional regulator
LRESALLDAAAALFLERGYGATTLESVVQAAGISKRTLYQRYPDKEALFAAVLAHIFQRLRPPDDVPLVQGEHLPEVLERLAGFMLQGALQPSALAVHRLVTAESGRFPEIGQMLAGNALVRLATSLVADLLTRPPVADRASGATRMLPAAHAEFLATQFLVLVVTHPQRAACGLAPALSAEQLARWPRDCVALFLHGALAGSAA